MFVFCKYLKILMVSDKTIINNAFRIHKTLYQNKENIFIFTIYQNYTLALMYTLNILIALSLY